MSLSVELATDISEDDGTDESRAAIAVEDSSGESMVDDSIAGRSAT